MEPEIEKSQSLSRVREIRTKRLFGLYDHHVPLFLNDRVTIVHGANGVGKTVLLRLVHAIFSHDYLTLLSVPYEELVVTLTDDTQISISQPTQTRVRAIETPEESQQPLSILIRATPGGGIFPIEFEVRTDQFSFDRWAQQIVGTTSWLHLFGPDRYYDSRSEITYTAAELWQTFAREGHERRPTPLNTEIPSEYNALISKVKTHLVETQRLMRVGPKAGKVRRSESPTFTPAVMFDAQELAAKLRDAFTQYGRESQKLDQTFPQRLFNLPQVMSPPQIKSLLSDIENDQGRLAKLGILDSPRPYPFSPSIFDGTDTAKLDAMDLFVRDSKEKLRPLLNFASRIEPLLSNINAKFKNKSIQLDREKGLIAIAADGSEIRPDQLSSGEQHEIVLLFHLLFRISKNTLVLIDEPELSLHIDWQRQVLPELLEIAERIEIDALVATHSPYIAGERDELMISLDSSPD